MAIQRLAREPSNQHTAAADASWTRLARSSAWSFGSSPNPAYAAPQSYGPSFDDGRYSLNPAYQIQYDRWMYGPAPRYEHAAVMLEGTSAVDGDDTVGALVILGGLTDSALLGGGATSVDLGSDEDDGDDGESRMRLRARRQRRELRSGMHLTNLADSHLSLLPDVWRIGVGGPSGSVIGSWQRLEWRHSITGEQPARRYGHSAAVLPSGDIFMFGGVVHAVFSAGEKDKDGSSSSSSSSGKSKGRNVLPTRASADAWLLRGARSGRGSWHRVERKNGASWPPARAFHTCTAVSDALLLVGGRGEDGEGLADMWVYRDGLWEQMPPVGGAYNPVIAPVFARVGQSAVTLPLSTRVLTFGGVDGNNELLDLVSLYNPPVCSASGKEEWSQAAAACVDCPSGTQAVPIVSEKKRSCPRHRRRHRRRQARWRTRRGISSTRQIPSPSPTRAAAAATTRRTRRAPS